jgi:hypothetical protein
MVVSPSGVCEMRQHRESFNPLSLHYGLAASSQRSQVNVEMQEATGGLDNRRSLGSKPCASGVGGEEMAGVHRHCRGPHSVQPAAALTACLPARHSGGWHSSI